MNIEHPIIDISKDEIIVAIITFESSEYKDKDETKELVTNALENWVNYTKEGKQEIKLCNNSLALEDVEMLLSKHESLRKWLEHFDMFNVCLQFLRGDNKSLWRTKDPLVRIKKARKKKEQ